MTGARKADPTELDPFRRVLARHCSADAWSADMQHCLLATRTIAEGDACGKYLSAEQAQALQSDGQAALENMGSDAAK